MSMSFSFVVKAEVLADKTALAALLATIQGLAQTKNVQKLFTTCNRSDRLSRTYILSCHDGSNKEEVIVAVTAVAGVESCEHLAPRYGGPVRRPTSSAQ